MQEEILQLLKKERRAMSLGEISRKLREKDIVKVSKRISRLVKYKEVQYKEVDRGLALVLYGCKRRLKVYYIR